jgi:hypothetical protein
MIGSNRAYAPLRPAASRTRSGVRLTAEVGCSSVLAQCMFSAVGPTLADCVAVGLVKHVVLPGKHGVLAVAATDAVKAAGPPWNGGPAGSADIVTGIVVGVPSQGNSKLGRNPNLKADARAIALPAACSTCTLMFSETSVNDGSNAEHVTVTGSVIATRLVRLGVPRLNVAAPAADAVAAQAARTAVVRKSPLNAVLL